MRKWSVASVCYSTDPVERMNHKRVIKYFWRETSARKYLNSRVIDPYNGIEWVLLDLRGAGRVVEVD